MIPIPDTEDQLLGRDSNAAKVFVFPTSYAQRSLWILHQLAPESAFYNVPSAVRIRSTLNTTALERSVNEILRRHESLRTAFKSVDGEPVQVVASTLQIDMPVIDLRDLTPAKREEEAYRIATEEAQKPFDLQQWPLIRTKVLRLADQEYIHLLTIHHINCDFWSMNILFTELSTVYDAYCLGVDSPLPEPEVQYGDYAEWEGQYLRGQKGLSHLAYWKDKLNNLSVLELPTDWPRPALPSYMGASHYFTLPASLYRALLDLSTQENLTLFMTTLAAFQALLHRYSSQDDIVVGTPVANRNRPEVEGVIGFFVNSLVLRSDLSGNPSFRELMRRVRSTALDAFAKQDIPFEKLVHELQPERNAGHNPLFQVHFQLLSADGGGLGNDVAVEASEGELFEAGLEGEPFEVEVGTAKFDLALDLWESENSIEGQIEYSTDLFEEETIIRMAGHFRTLLEGIALDPSQRLSELPLLTEREREQLLRDWNDTKSDWQPDRCIHQLFEAQADRTPDAVALAFREEEVTYANLNRRANQLANYLRALGVGSEMVVGICVERSLEMVLGIMGILKAGAAYLPLDPYEPGERLREMLQEAHASLILTQRHLTQSVSALPVQHLSLDSDWEKVALCSHANLSVDISTGNLAYVIYTSGSLGRPKGVMVEHRAACNQLVWMQNTFPLTPSDRVLLKYPFNFDASIVEIFGTLVAGARLIIAEPYERWDIAEFVRVLAEEEVTVLDVVPSMLEALIDEEAFSACRSLRRVICGGESLSAELRDHFFAKFDAELHNIYGPTEAAVGATSWRCFPGDIARSVPIGRPGANMQIYLLDSHFNLVPVGVPGEIHIGGDGLARGYLNQPQLTAEKFIPNPFVSLPDARMYQTGDRGRFLPDGTLEYLGRSDHQVKVRGYRVELSEIESVLARHPAVNTCVVLSVNDEAEHTRLVAYVVAKQHEPELWPSLGEYEVYDEMLYYAMTHDDVRNSAYRSAICNYVKDKVVLDIGTGADAVLAKFCVEGQAHHVYAIEIDQVAFRCAQKLIDENGLAGRITLLHGDSTYIQLPEQVDVCVSEILGTIGSSEGVVPILNNARRFLKNGGIMIPRRCVTLIAPISLPTNLANSLTLGATPLDYAERVFKKAGHPFDLRICIKNFPQSNLISKPEIYEDLCFLNVIPPNHQSSRTFTINRDAQLDGFLLWLNVYPGGEEFIDSLNSKTSWLPVFFPAFYPGCKVSEGDTIEITCSCTFVEDARMPDYEIKGILFRGGQEPVEFSYTSPYRTRGFRQIPFYQSLFAGFDFDNVSEKQRGDASSYALVEDTTGSLVPDLRKFLRERLPHYMVPVSFVMLDELPRAPSGKIDRRALELKPNLKRGRDYVPPRNVTEEVLAEIWSELLGVEQIGINDDFFELGGDSILSIQVVARANQAGIGLRPAQLFQYQTISEIAAVAGSVPVTLAEQSILTGAVPLTPIQHWFFQQNLSDSYHYTQSALIELAPSADLAKLRTALDRVVTHHDALRLRFVLAESGWQQTFGDASDAVTLDCLDLSLSSEEEQDSVFQKKAAQLQSSLDLAEGPLTRAALIDVGDSKTTYLFLVIHHLVIDTVSWSILLEDLWTVYEQLIGGAEIKLPPKTTSFQRWSRLLTDYAQSPDLEAEIEYWLALSQVKGSSLPRDYDEGVNIASSANTILVVLGVEETRSLLYEIPKAYRTQINEVLLTALAQAFSRWSGQDGLLVDIEGHGRETIVEDVDLSRTVGWFTSVFPMFLRPPFGDDPGRALRSIKEQLRQVPHRGIGYGLLRYLGDNEELKDRLRALPQPEVAFNYLGQLGASQPRSLRWKRLSDLMGPSLGPRNHRPILLEIDGGVAEGRLELSWTYSENIHRRSTIETLADQFADALRRLIEHCREPSKVGYSPKDFANVRLSQKELDKLLQDLQ